MARFAIEHLPKHKATYQVTPVDYNEARDWLTAGDVTSLVRTTELIDAIRAGFGIVLEQSDESMVLAPGDKALLISLSFSVLLAWAEGDIVPLEGDWRCLLLGVADEMEPVAPPVLAASTDLLSTVE